ncbi:S-layer homology domain-containing protein [Sporosarcina sp. FSL K6-5500]|uniref:S-layer homology domain-containing protein n=1 Tax=Sporosarcina sp. FSL K6-5500 TaxID=2921558 RepID=UPI0030F82029
MANQPSKYSKFLVGAASAALVASAVAPIASAADFKDTKGNTHEEAINALSDAGVISGYQDGTFLPNKTLTRSDVVKLMGKWLVSEGSVVPTDYKTNPRFADLKSTSNDELLKFAAVVKDNGVFVGTPDGKLDPTGNITRENMAVVLVRAFDRVHEIDLTTYVAGQDFKKDVTDLGKAKAEARPAIDVLDFFNITNPAAPAFNPKETTTRGQFATFLYKTTKTDFSDVTSGIVGSADIKAVNATTVEVAFKEKVENLNSLNFKIDGLTVSNAAVKQSDDKVVVLTTAVQKGGEKYTVTLNEKAIGSFSGISSVIPTKIDITTQSVQGKVGAQAILSADVGVKQAGIPVTFNVKANTIGTLNKDQVFETLTNADGIATFSYTQYAAGTDSVVAYPTGAPTVRSLGYVFWGVDTILAVEEVTTGSTINNGANKTYKVTFKNATTGNPATGQNLNVSFLENLNVTADKISNATVNGVQPVQLSNNSAPVATQITTDSKGEATFTVSGTNTEVTPIVFEANNTVVNGNVVKDFKYEASDLQAKAAKVKFAAVQADYVIDVARDGGETAALNSSNGRKYNVVVKDKDGKLAANEVVNVAFNEDLDRVIATNTEAKFIKVNSDDTQQYHPTSAVGDTAKQISVKTNAKGEASFVIGSDKDNDYATPVAWIDVNTPNAVEGKLDEGEPKTLAAISYFKPAYLDGAALKVYKDGKATTSDFKGSESATFKASLVNQSNKTVANTSINKVSYTIFNTGANDVIVGNQIISPNRSYTVTYETPNTDLVVRPTQDKNASVRVVATGIAKDTDGKDYAFTAKEATATFAATKAVSALYTGDVESYNSKDEELVFVGKDPVSYTGSGYVYKGVGNTPIATAEDFIKELKKGKVTVTREVKDGVTTFYIVEQVSGTTGPKDTAVVVPEPTLTAKTVARTVVVGADALTFTASELATSNKDLVLSLVGTATSDNATVASATVTDNKLVITPGTTVGTAEVTVNVTDGKLTTTATVTVKVEAVNTNVTLSSLTGAYEIQDNTDVDKYGVVLELSKLPAALQNATSYTIDIGGVKYELTKNRFNANVFSGQVDSTKHTKAQVEAGIITKN